jgi:hypothetical protein
MDEFLKALSEFSADVPAAIEFRVYYQKETGSIIGYTTEQWDGDYIIVEKQAFHENRFDVRVKDGKLIYPKPTVGKLQPSENGTPCHPKDITIVVENNTTARRWEMHTAQP